MSISSKFECCKKILKEGESDTLREKATILPIKATRQVEVYKVDGCVIPKIEGQLKCDFLIYNVKEKVSKFIELKGKDVKHACNQIHDTVLYFERDKELEAVVNKAGLILGYIVSPNCNVPNIADTHRKKVCRKLHAKSQYKLDNFFKHLIFIRCLRKISGDYKAKDDTTLLVTNHHPLDV